MKNALIILLCLSATAASAQADCDKNTGNNASIFVMKSATTEVHSGDRLRAYGESGCVGSAYIADASGGGDAYALTVWGNDEITPDVDGLTPNEPIAIVIEHAASEFTLDNEAPFSSSLTYAPDRLYLINSITFDSTTVAELDSLNNRIDAIGAELDTAYVLVDYFAALASANEITADSLQTIVEAQLVNITDLQSQLTNANATIDSLEIVIANLPNCTACETALAAAQSRVAELEGDVLSLNAALVVSNDKLRQIAQIANSNKGRYRPILDVLYP